MEEKPKNWFIKYGRTFWMILGSLCILLVISWRVDLGKTWQTLIGMDIYPLILAVILASFASYILGGYKWMKILKSLGYKIPYRKILFVRLGSEPVKFILPAKAGELIRPAYLKTEFGVPLPIGIGSLGLDKLFNLYGLLVTFALGVMLSVSLLFALAILAICLLLMILVHRASRPISDLLEKKPGRIYKALARLLATLHKLTLAQTLFQLVLGWTFLFTEICTGYLALTAAGVDVSLVEAMTYLPAVILLVQVPVTISGIGTREAGMVAFFISLATRETLFAVGIAYTVVELIIPVMLGLPFMSLLVGRVDWKSLPGIARNG